MTRYLLKATVKPGKKAELAAHIKEGAIARGAPYERSLLQGLHGGRATLDEAYFIVDVPQEQITDVQEAVSTWFTIDRVVPEPDVPLHERDDLQAYDALPDWAGVDRE